MQKFKVGERVASIFGFGSDSYGGTVIALERGMPVVKFDNPKIGTRRQSRSNCIVIGENSNPRFLEGLK